MKIKAYRIKISGNWGHFRRPETNNNPISFDFIPKTALIGLIAATIGLNRKQLKIMYSDLCTNILYSVRLLNPISKLSHSFRIYKYKGDLMNIVYPPQAYELLKLPAFEVILAGTSDVLNKFIDYVKSNKAIYTPTLGLINCPAELEFIEELELEEKKQLDKIMTLGLIPKESKVIIDQNVAVSYDEIPISQDNNWKNNKTQSVYYSYSKYNKGVTVINVTSIYYEKVSKEWWFLI